MKEFSLDLIVMYSESHKILTKIPDTNFLQQFQAIKVCKHK